MIAAEHDKTVALACEALERLRSERPRVHCLTNFVAMELSANLLLAVGAVPSMTMDRVLMRPMVTQCRGLLVNMGQLDPWRRDAIPEAIMAAIEVGIGWVLDPVKIDMVNERRIELLELIRRRPAVVRCNQAERDAIIGTYQTPVFAITGPTDRIQQGARRLEIEGGSPLMDRVTAMGCASSALVAAFLAVERDPFAAAVSAMLVMKVAGSIAAEAARGPGSFKPAFLDAVYGLDADTLHRAARLR